MNNSVDTSILVLAGILVLSYFFMRTTSSEAMTILRFRPFMSGQPAPVDYDDNIAGISDPNSHEVLPNVNQYSNDLAFNPNNPNSANYTMDGHSVLDPPAYQYLGNRDGDTNGRN